MSDARAIVIGSGMSGLAAAAFAARHFDEVVLVERDAVGDRPGERAGLPQGRHAHALLVKGRVILERLFPGIVEEIVADGANWFDYGSDTVLRVGGRPMPRAESGVRALACTRGLLEFRVRERLLANPRVRLLDGTRVTGLQLDAAGRSVVGVRLRARAGGGDEETLSAGLVVATSGRSSQVCQWLESAGFGRARESAVDAHVGYASRLYAVPEDCDDWKVVGIGVTWPEESRGGAMLKVESDRLLVTLVGAGGDYPPTDEQAYLAYAASLAHPVVHDTIAKAIPLGPITAYRGLKNRWRHFEELPRWPEGFVALGDSVCVFNPIYAQGMTVGLTAAEMLGRRLADSGGRVEGLAPAFQRDLARALRVPWLMATTEDRWWASDGRERVPLTARVTRLYVRRLQSAMSGSPALARRFLHVMHMTRPPATLLAPAAIARVLWAGAT